MSYLTLQSRLWSGWCDCDFLEIAIRQFSELGTSIVATPAFWLSCSFVTCKSYGLVRVDFQKPIGFLMSKCPKHRPLVS